MVFAPTGSADFRFHIPSYLYDIVNAGQGGKGLQSSTELFFFSNMFPNDFWQRMPSPLLMEEMVTGG